MSRFAERENKRVVIVTDFQRNILTNALHFFRNALLEKGKPTEDVDRMLVRVIEAPIYKEKRRSEPSR